MAITTERLALEQATREAHQVAKDLREAVRAAREEMRVSAKETARRYLSKAFIQASESLKKP
jgi:hypothetical protein